MERRNKLSPHADPKIAVTDRDEEIAPDVEEANRAETHSNLGQTDALSPSSSKSPSTARKVFESEDEDTEMIAPFPPQEKSKSTEPNERPGCSAEWKTSTIPNPDVKVKASTSVKRKFSQVTTRVSPVAEIITFTDRSTNSPVRPQPLANVVRTGRPTRLETVSEIASLQYGRSENLQGNDQPVLHTSAFARCSNVEPVASTSARCENPEQRAKPWKTGLELSTHFATDDQRADWEVGQLTSSLQAQGASLPEVRFEHKPATTQEEEKKKDQKKK